MRVRATPTSVCLQSSGDQQWYAIRPALECKAKKARKLSAAEQSLMSAADSVVSFLAAVELMTAAREVVEWAAAEKTCLPIGEDEFARLPLTPLSFRDAGLYGRHIKQATKGFVKVFMSEGHFLQALLGLIIGKPLRLPDGLASNRPPYYHGNPLTFIGADEVLRWPSHTKLLDYELEIAVVITRRVSPDAREEEVAAAIGGFVLINDFSARCVQADEMLSLGFGFIKCKAFATAIAKDVFSAAALWSYNPSAPPGQRESGRLLDSPGLECRVSVDGEVWSGAGRASTADPSRACSIVELVQWCALDEGLEPGELIGLGTVPDCCGVELGKWLSPGARITLEVETMGSLSTTIGAQPAHATAFKELEYGGGAKAPGRGKLALRLVVLAALSPLLGLALLVGALSALRWPQPVFSRPRGMTLGAGGALLVALILLAAPVAPVAPTPPLRALQELPTSTSDWLERTTHVGAGTLVGPESLAVSADGRSLYTGLADGRIVRLDADLQSWTTIARTGADADTCGTAGEKWGGAADTHGLEDACGRPLGMRMTRRKMLVSSGDPNEEVLVVTDAYKGLLMVSGLSRPEGEASVVTLARKAEGDAADSRFQLLNDVAVLPSGEVYFTETSRRFPRRRIFYAAFSGQPEGRLLRWDRARGVAVVIRDGLFMPNGVTPMHGSGGGLVLVLNVTSAWTYEPASDTLRHFADFLGTGDNIRTQDRTPSGKAVKCYWLGWGSKYAKPFSLIYALSSLPLLKRFIITVVPYWLFVKLIPKMGMLAVLDEHGTLLELYLDPSARTPWLSEAEEFRGKLVLGSWFNPFLAVVDPGA